MISMLLALNAAAIDSMLPALGLIGDHFAIKNPNDQQLVVFSYLIGFSAPQLVFGPISDRYGRVGLLKLCLVGFIIFGAACMYAPSFGLLLLFRFLQGFTASGIRVIAVSIVRDLLAGRGMAKVMSLVMTVFMIVPVIAPITGQVLMVYSWRWTFGLLVVLGILVLIWVTIRLPETLPEERRQSLGLKSAINAYIDVLKVRQTAGYMAASGVIYGSLFAFLGASEQVFREVFHQEHNFSLLFAGVASTMAVTSFLNSRLVERYGMRRISHFVQILFVVFALSNVVALTMFGEKLILFYPLFALTIGCFGMMGANFNAIAMEPHGKNAGSASAAYGFATTGIASLFGTLVARQYDGSIIPMLWGFTFLGLGSLIIVLITERGKLFQTSV